MYNKKKNKKFKRIFALVGVFVIILSALVIPSGAWSKTDISFFNYVDLSKVKTISPSATTAGIVSVDSDMGDIYYEFFVNDKNDNQVSYTALNLKLSDLCPDIVLGETYVFSQHFISEDENLSSLGYFYLKTSIHESAVKVYFGQPFFYRPEYSDAYVILSAGYYPNGAQKPENGTRVTSVQKLWANKDKAFSFEPYDLFKDMLDTSYEQGKSEGYNSGLTEGTKKGYDEGYGEGYNKGLEKNIMDDLLVSRNNLSIQLGFYDKQSSAYIYQSYDHLDYPFNGYSFNSKLLHNKYLTPPNDSSVFGKIHVMLIPRTYGVEYVVGSSKFSFIANHQYGVAEITIISDAIDNQLHSVTKRYASAGVGVGVDVNFTDFGLKDGDKIDALSITYVEMGNTHEKPIEGFSFAFTDTANNSYIVGVEEGKSQGYTKGYSEGLGTGKEEGLKQGFDSGYKEGHDVGYKEGDNAGYYRGRSDEAKQSGFFALIYNVIDAPVTVFSKMLNFNILGVNMMGLASSLITFAILVTVVKYFV